MDTKFTQGNKSCKFVCPVIQRLSVKIDDLLEDLNIDGRSVGNGETGCECVCE